MHIKSYSKVKSHNFERPQIPRGKKYVTDVMSYFEFEDDSQWKIHKSEGKD